MAALSEKQLLFVGFFSNSITGAALYDKTGKWLYSNQALESLQKTTGGSFLPIDLFSSSFLSERQKNDLEEGKPVLLSHPLKMKIAAVDNHGERVGYTLAIFPSEACFKRNCLNQKIAETAQDTILLVNSRRVIEQVVSPGTDSSLFSESIVGKRLEDLPDFDCPKACKENMKTAFERCQAGKRTDNRNISTLTHNGEKIYFQVRIVPLQQGYFLIYLRNVTGEKLKEKENSDLSSMLSESRSMMELALKNSRITTYSFNFDRFAQCDKIHCKQCFQFCGAPNRLLEKNRYICRALSKVSAPDDRTDFFFLFDKIRNEKLSEYTTTFRIRNDSGEFRSYDVIGKVHGTGSDGTPNLIIGYIIDNHDRIQTEEKLIREKEKAELADQLKSTFLANMTHDIRTPLNAIVGFADLLSLETDPEMRRTYLDLIQTNNNLLTSLVNDVLDISKIEANCLALNYSDVYLPELIQDIYQTVNLKVPEGIRLVADEGESLTLHTDYVRLSQIFMNLLSNAIKYTSEGSIRFGYRQEPPFVRFYVSDTGCGMPEEELENIFIRFVQLKGHKPGTGLGLAICKGLVGQLGGTISVRSETGRGSTFEFTLPLLAGRNGDE